MKDKNKCRFSGCEKTINDWERYCEEHRKYMENLKIALCLLDVHWHEEEMA